MNKLHKYYLKACKALGKTPVPELTDKSDSDLVSVDAYARLIICIAYKNMVKGKRWYPVYDGSEWHYYVRVWPNASSSGFSSSSNDRWFTSTYVGARLEYRSRELSEQGLIEFKAYYIDYFLLQNPESEK
jgi:hypothetical protein